MFDLRIRPIHTFAEYRACEELQRQAWAMPDDLEVVPLHLLVTMQRSGGLLLGAFEGSDLLGFVFGFLGHTADGRPKHCSHMMGVAPHAQHRGIGYRLKLAQRQHALAQGLDLVTWTFDPLQSPNAHLNLHKLGGLCRTYLRDLYGDVADELSSGPPSDRLELEWWIRSDRVRRRVAGEAAPPAPEPASLALGSRITPAGQLAPGPVRLDDTAPSVWVEIPADFVALKVADPALALEWRLATREVLEATLALGYAAVDCLRWEVEGKRCARYLLTKMLSA